VLTNHAPHLAAITSSARLSAMNNTQPLMFPSYSSENLREYKPISTMDSYTASTDHARESTYLSALWNMITTSSSSSSSQLPSSPFGTNDDNGSSIDTVSSRGARMARQAYEKSKLASSRFCYGICGGWGSGDGLFGVLSSGGPFGLGLRLGIFLVLLVWVLWDCLGDISLWMYQYPLQFFY
jgi:hypothetical protein